MTKPDPIYDPLGLEEAEAVAANAPAPPLVLTGLSDEEDAGRVLALEFNKDVLLCPNCEAFYDRAGMTPGPPYDSQKYDRNIKVFCFCPRCGDLLRAVGARPRRWKFNK